MKERRRFVRFNMGISLYYRVLESLKGHISSYTADVSEKGIRILIPEPFELYTYLELAISLPNEYEPILGIGRIIWLKKKGSAFEAGVELTYIKERDKDRFNKLMQELEGKVNRNH